MSTSKENVANMLPIVGLDNTTTKDVSADVEDIVKDVETEIQDEESKLALTESIIDYINLKRDYDYEVSESVDSVVMNYKTDGDISRKTRKLIIKRALLVARFKAGKKDKCDKKILFNLKNEIKLLDNQLDKITSTSDKALLKEIKKLQSIAKKEAIKEIKSECKENDDVKTESVEESDSLDDFITESFIKDYDEIEKRARIAKVEFSKAIKACRKEIKSKNKKQALQELSKAKEALNNLKIVINSINKDTGTAICGFLYETLGELCELFSGLVTTLIIFGKDKEMMAIVSASIGIVEGVKDIAGVLKSTKKDGFSADAFNLYKNTLKKTTGQFENQIKKFETAIKKLPDDVKTESVEESLVEEVVIETTEKDDDKKIPPELKRIDIKRAKLEELEKSLSEALDKLSETGEKMYENKVKGLTNKIEKLREEIKKEEEKVDKLQKESALTESVVLEAREMEDEIKPIVEKLEAKGYKVKYASPGHRNLRKKEDKEPDGVYYDHLYSDARIMFEDNYNLSEAPEYWHFREVDGCTYLDISPLKYDEKKDGSPDKAFEKWKTNYMNSLKKYVDELPNRSEKEVKESFNDMVDSIFESMDYDFDFDDEEITMESVDDSINVRDSILDELDRLLND